MMSLGRLTELDNLILQTRRKTAGRQIGDKDERVLKL